MADDGEVLIREVSTETVVQPRLPESFGAHVRVHDAPAAPREWLITTGSVVLGAGRGADMVIGDESVSRKHLQIALSSQGIEVIDLNSSNGTYYQGQRIGRLTLDREATFLLGRVRVTVSPQVQTDASQGRVVTRYGELVGGSSAVRSLFANLSQLEQSTVPLLIEGEAGTGKELMAREIHQRSPVRNGPFIAVNSLVRDGVGIARQLFGAAGSSNPGVFELAHEGTLFFDEISDVPIDLQPLVLRALEAGKVLREGERQERIAKVRIIAATRDRLADHVAMGRFRQDLYYRLNPVLLRVPPLREHREDIGVLAQHFAAAHGILRLPPTVVEQLERYDWPGNVRELRSVISGYAAIGELPQAPLEDDTRLAEMLRRVLDVERPYQQQKDHILNKFLDVYLSMLLEYTGGNQSQASRMSGIERAHLNRMIAKLRTDSTRSTSGAPDAEGNRAPPGGKRRNSSLPPRHRS